MKTVFRMVLASAILLGTVGGSPKAAAYEATDLRCRLLISPLGLNWGNDEVFFVGTGTGDSAAVTDAYLPPLFTPLPAALTMPAIQPRTVYGQIVRVDSLGGAAADSLRATLGRMQSRDVVVISWNHDPSCRVVPRGGFLVPPGEVAFYAVRLRPPHLWANGKPTLDAVPAEMAAYPFGQLFQMAFRRSDSDQMLTVRELFSLRSALPNPWNKALSEVDGARLRRWATLNPTIVGRYPAEEILRTRLSR